MARSGAYLNKIKNHKTSRVTGVFHIFTRTALLQFPFQKLILLDQKPLEFWFPAVVKIMMGIKIISCIFSALKRGQISFYIHAQSA